MVSRRPWESTPIPGIAGLTLGGGFGKLGRKHGLSCDNLIAAEIVTADGRVLRASATENADLFWGIRGGGGNFGIVTTFEYRLHPVGRPAHGRVCAPPLRARARCGCDSTTPFQARLRTSSSVDAALITVPSGDRFFSISACYIGPLDEGKQAVQPLRAYGTPVEDRIVPVSYLQIQSAGDSIFPRGRRYFWKAQFLDEITDQAIDTLLAAYASAPASRCLCCSRLAAQSRVYPSAETPYANRDALYDCFPISIWDNPADDEAHIRWARDLWDSMRPFSTGGVYANNLGEEGTDWIQAAYGENYPRLAALKKSTDPANFFSLDQNIVPTR